MHYRPEVDGLRTVAVLPVILFHAGVSVFSGGFVGVDIFFVISGYLITGILISELEKTGKVSILGFYERRFRRILPALLFVMACCLPAAWFFLLPAQLDEFGRNVIAVALFVSNIVLWLNTDYFAADAELNPLLHTWSLAVEEQFYIVIPLLLWSVWRAGRNRALWVIVGISAISLAATEWGWRNEPSANFYLLPFRAWELGAGSICAFLLHGKPAKSNQWLSLIGLAMIGCSIFAFTGETPFPSLWALLPVAGTALIILYARSDTFVGKALSDPMMVGIGLISYSAYLWHQPLFAFARITSDGHPSMEIMMLLSVASLALAYLTWRFIENPFRKVKQREPLVLKKQGPLLTASAVGVIAFIGIGATGMFTEGLPQRTTPSGKSYAELDLDNRLAPNRGLDRSCTGSFKLTSKCRTSQDATVALWGDSYAMHLGQGLLHSTTERDFVQLTKSSCAPILGISINSAAYPNKFGEECIAFNDQVMEFLTSGQIEIVIMSTVFTAASSDIYVGDGNVIKEGPEASEAIIAAIADTARALHEANLKVVWVSPPPRTGDDLSTCAVKAVIAGDTRSSSCQIRFNPKQGQYTPIYEQLAKAEEHIPVLYLHKLLCEGTRCPTLLGSRIVYVDNGHLTIEASRYIGQTYDLMGLALDVAR